MRMQNLSILLVEDDDIDRLAIRRALRERGVEAEIVEAHDGQEALDILAGKSETAMPASPFFILLDLNMPAVDGITFLSRLRDKNSNISAQNAVVFVLTTSAAERDIERAYEHAVAGYIVKSDYDESMDKLVDLLCSYRTTVEFPCSHV